ncbi:MAG TPA: TIGR03620 family F420-dependent LLM class oxidoreductase [Pseudonocardia sp.]|jgi:probable F420-dependent oxidoreductase|nr:TIGR03620 family F420-dependent LLM class oxidoreductase [Pseudonocardia sp.]
MELGTLGIWSMQLRDARRDGVREAVAELDALGFGTLWIPGLDGKGVFDDVDALLAAAPRVAVALGVLAVWGQHPADVGRTIAELDAAHGPRTLLGLGVSSPESAAAVGQEWGNPLDTMSNYLDELAATEHPVTRDRLLLGALGPRMARLAATRTAGLHPFLVPAEYSEVQRAQLGAEALVAPHLAVVLDTDPARARDIARAGIGFFFGLPAYRANLARFGFGDDDVADGGSDRLVDAVVAHGDLAAVAGRIRRHLDAGADHVALHVLTGDNDLPRAQWRELATLLGPDGKIA